MSTDESGDSVAWDDMSSAGAEACKARFRPGGLPLCLFLALDDVPTAEIFLGLLLGVTAPLTLIRRLEKRPVPLDCTGQSLALGHGVLSAPLLALGLGARWHFLSARGRGVPLDVGSCGVRSHEMCFVGVFVVVEPDFRRMEDGDSSPPPPEEAAA